MTMGKSAILPQKKSIQMDDSSHFILHASQTLRVIYCQYSTFIVYYLTFFLEINEII